MRASTIESGGARFWTVGSFAAVMFSLGGYAAAAESPYPPSDFITGVTFDWSTHETLAPGSDNWPITWASDDNQYVSWGDGGGFNGTNSDGRVSLGFGRIEGDWDSWQGFNVWGGKSPENPAQFDGKSYGIISVQGVLYAWWGPGSGNTFANETRVLQSSNLAATWTQSSWRWRGNTDGIYAGSFLNFGKDNAGARDSYVYSYFVNGSDWDAQCPGQAVLARVPNDQVMEQSAYEWYAGLDGNEMPIWVSNVASRQPVFEDPNCIRTVSVTYNPGLRRYLLTAQIPPYGQGLGTTNWIMYEGIEPWGPWKTVAVFDPWEDDQGQEHHGLISFYFAPKWFSADGKDFTMVFTDADQWGSIRGRFTTVASDQTPPTAPSNLQAVSVSAASVDLSWAAASDPESGISFYNVYRDAVQVGSTAALAFQDAGLSENTSYVYHVTAVNGALLEGPASNQITVLTLPDTTRPTLANAVPGTSGDTVAVFFSEPVSAQNAEVPSNYSVDGGVAVMAATLLSDPSVVELMTSQLSHGVLYTLTVSNVSDRADVPNFILPNSSTSFMLVEISTEGLVAHWSFEGDASDSAGANDGTIVGPELFEEGIAGQGISLDGAYVDIPPSGSLDNLDVLTYSAWILPHQSGDREVISKNGSVREFRLAGSGSSVYLRGCVSAATNACSDAVAGSIAIDAWQHIAMTYDHGGDKKVHLYIDGVEVSYAQQTTASGNTDNDATSPMNIGRRTSGDRLFDGAIDEVRVYDRALDASEIEALASEDGGVGGLMRPAPPTDLTAD